MAQRPTHYSHQSLVLVGPASTGSPLALLAAAMREAGWGVTTAHMPGDQTEAFALCRGHSTIVLVPELPPYGARGWMCRIYEYRSITVDMTSSSSSLQRLRYESRRHKGLYRHTHAL